MAKMYWSPEEVPGPEFLRRINMWFEETTSRTLTLRRDHRKGEIHATMTNVVRIEGQVCDLVRQFSTPVVEVSNAIRSVSGEDIRLHEVEPGDGPEGDHHESCDCSTCAQKALF